MPWYPDNLSQATAELPNPAFRRMARLVQLLDRLSRNPAYRRLVMPVAPAIAGFDPGHDAVMMCHDFHLTEAGPKLIEVNTNAGGSLPAFLADRQRESLEAGRLPAKVKARLLGQFAAEFQRFTAGKASRPARIVILDDRPEQQFLYQEMRIFADLFRDWGAAAAIADPGELEAGKNGVFLNGKPVDMVYNRHCDFYLEGEAMRGLREAYLAKRICLSPNPHVYALLADKRRMVLWTEADFTRQVGLTEQESQLLQRTVPKSRLLQDLDPEQVWEERRDLVFKPVAKFGSRGVLLGGKTTRKRFGQLPPDETLVQELVPPSMTEVPGREEMKTDFRVFAYRNRLLGVTARLYRGQVTNLRTEGGGFAKVALVDSRQ